MLLLFSNQLFTRSRNVRRVYLGQQSTISAGGVLPVSLLSLLSHILLVGLAQINPSVKMSFYIFVMFI